jgi:hypothetical protein
MRRVSPLPLLLCPVLAACTQAAPPSDTTPVDDSKNKFTVTTEQFDVPAGDWFECFYTGVVTKEAMSVVGAAGKQAQGGHHIGIYYTYSTATGHHECNDAEMTTWNQIVAANGKEASGEPVVSLPAGLAFKVPAGVQLVIQSHYINTTGDTMKGVQDQITMNLVDPSTVEAYANLWTVTDLVLDIPANGKSTAVSTFTMKEDLSLLLFGGHMHELGSHYRLEILDDQGQLKENYYEHDWTSSYASHPPLLQYPKDNPYVLKKGTKLRMTCEWNNTSPMEVKFPREMCLGFGYYFPDTGGGQLSDISAHQPSP